MNPKVDDDTLVSITFQLKWFGGPNYGFNLSFFKFQNLKGSNLVKWQDNQNKTYRSWLSWTTFVFITFTSEIIYGFKIWFELVKFQISNFKMCKTLSHLSLIKLKYWSMILENFRKKKPSHLELVWGRITSYKVYPQIKKRNHTVLDDLYMIIVNSVISFFNLWVNFITSFSYSY